MDYKFKIDSKIPPDDTIDKHKDFKRLKANYDKQVAPLYKKPLYKDPKALIVVLIIALLTYILVEVYQKEEHEGPKMDQQDQKVVAPKTNQQTGKENSNVKDSTTIKSMGNSAADSIKKRDLAK